MVKAKLAFTIVSPAVMTLRIAWERSNYPPSAAGLSGDTAERRAETGSVVEAVEESWQRLSDFFWEQDKGRKESLLTMLMSFHLPLTLTKLEKICAANNSPDGWIVGSKVIAVVCFILR